MKLVVEYEVPDKYREQVVRFDADGDSTALREIADNIGWGEVTVAYGQFEG